MMPADDEELKLKREMCRYIHAALNDGFDGEEHPEYNRVVTLLLNGPLYPLSLADLVKLINERKGR